MKPEFLAGGEPIQLSTCVKRGDDGFYLCVALAHTLKAHQRLSHLNLTHEDDLFSQLEPDYTDTPHFLELNDQIIENYDDDLLYDLYVNSQGNKLMDSHVLNCWIRAWCNGADTFMQVHQQCQSSEVLASLVERGGNVLMSLRL